MARRRDPFGEVLNTLRVRLRDGVYGPGETLNIAELSEELRLSTTPIREALARLAGEGLVEDQRGRGYQAASLDLADLLELYDLSFLHVSLALERTQIEAAVTDAVEPLDAAAQPAELAAFEAGLLGHVVRRSGHRALIEANARLLDRLGPARLAGARLAADPLAELRSLTAALAGGDLATLRGELERYHARRRAEADAVVRSMRRPR